MTFIPPDLADKAGSASMRNLLKEVSEGAVLSPANRQLILALASMDDPEAVRKARETSLLIKHLTAGRLSREERLEIAHIIGEERPHEPPPSMATTGGDVATLAAARQIVSRGPDDYGHLKISRRTYYRWKKFGEQVPEGADMPPFDEPHLIGEWYERMKVRGFFKHRFPDDIAGAIATYLESTPGAASTAAASESKVEQPAGPPPRSVPEAFQQMHDESALGLIYEVRSEEKRVASLRKARDHAYQRGDRAEGDEHDRRYRDALDGLSLVQQRAIKIEEQEGRLVAVDIVAAELAPKIAAIVQGGALLWDRLGPEIMAQPDHAMRRKVWKEGWVTFCKGLVEGRFAPPLNLEDLAR